MKAIKKKMRSKKGFSFVEMLVATLILGLSTSALAAGVASSIRVYHASVTYSEERMLLSTLSEALTNELRNAKEANFGKSNDGSYILDNGSYILDTYTSSTYGFKANVKVEPTANRPGGVIKVNVYDLVGSGVYINNQLSARLLDESGDITDKIYYNKETNCYTFTIAVYSGSNDKAETRNISVTPLETPTIPD